MRAKNRPNSAFRPSHPQIFGLVSLLALAVFAIGCTKWSHPAKGQREYNSDSVICWKAADESGKTDYWPRYRVYKDCMIERGWSDK